MISRRMAMAATLGVAMTSIATGPASSQSPSGDAPFAVTYIEVAPKSAQAARKLIDTYRRSATAIDGVVRFDVMQRIGHANHFAIVEAWKSGAAREANAATPAGKSFRTAIEPLLITAYDERPHLALTVGSPAKSTPGAIHAVTHVDIIPTRKDEGVAMTRNLGDQSRGTPGNLRFDVLAQANRPNHMTLVETWRNPTSQAAHTTTARMITYRRTLQPMSGSLYDERLYVDLK